MPFHITDLSIHGFWYTWVGDGSGGESWNQSYQPLTTYTDGGLYLSPHLQQHCVSCPVTFTLGSWRGKRLFNSTTNP